MDLHYLKIFNTVAKYLSFKKASEVLHISQPALSIQIKKLESQTDMKLFYKIGNKMYLSDSGQLLFEYTKKIFAIVEELENKIINHSDYIGGTINLGGSNTPGTYLLPIAIGQMKKLYPFVTFNLHIANTSQITTMIENGTLDVAVNGGDCQYSNMVSLEKLFDDKLVVVASPKNPLCQKAQVTMEELSEEDFIVHEKTSQLYTSFQLFAEDFQLTENISMYLGSIDAIKHAVIADLGISFMPYYAVKSEIETGLLKELYYGHDVRIYPYNLIYNKKKSISNTVSKFIEVLKNVYQ